MGIAAIELLTQVSACRPFACYSCKMDLNLLDIAIVFATMVGIGFPLGALIITFVVSSRLRFDAGQPELGRQLQRLVFVFIVIVLSAIGLTFADPYLGLAIILFLPFVILPALVVTIVLILVNLEKARRKGLDRARVISSEILWVVTVVAWAVQVPLVVAGFSLH